MSKRVALVYRDRIFSPNSVEKDRAILEAVGRRLASRQLDVSYVEEREVSGLVDADIILSMGRFNSTLDYLQQLSDRRCRVINSSRSVRAAARKHLDDLMRCNQIPAAPLFDSQMPAAGGVKYWVKRGDASAQSAEDVRFAHDASEVRAILADFSQRGITETVVTEHVEGDLVKFYGVLSTGFFRMFYPTDDGDTKFDDEARNGQACHYSFDLEALRGCADKLARLTGLMVYGGDCIVRRDGSFALIDFNDWPSFSRCREEAADAIASLV